jgi:hypothetical protein
VSKKKKRLEKLRRNPKNVSFEELSQVLEDWGFKLDRISGSHHHFLARISEQNVRLSVPYRRPAVKEVYVTEALTLIDQIINEKQGEEKEDGE